ncbi:MAG: DUF5916 domain-containing protein, partial [bacterium]
MADNLKFKVHYSGSRDQQEHNAAGIYRLRSKMPLLCLTLAFWSISLCFGQKTMKALRVDSEAIKVDAMDIEEFWAGCQAVSDMIQTDPVEGGLPSESTEVKIAYSAGAFYIFAKLFHSEPDKIIKTVTRRDNWSCSDNIQVEIDSYHDHRNGYHFEVNAGGRQFDGILANDEQWIDNTWDAVWESSVKVHKWGWTAEIKIPFSCMRFRNQNIHEIGINFKRFIGHNQEWLNWIKHTSDMVGYISNFGHLTDIKDIDPTNPVVQLPYLSLRNLNTDKAFIPKDIKNLAYSAGLDLKYSWQKNVTLDFSMNPDFGQVEADRVVLNLSAFETFFPEKRPFFSEGKKLFETPYRLFYSRRIGRPPSLDPEVPDGGEVVDKPINTTILGAAKLTGKLQNGLQFGIVEAVTQQEYAAVDDGIGNISSSMVEPRSLFQVFRVQKDLLKNSTIGLLGTGVNRWNSNHAYSGGFDWNLGLPYDGYRFNGQIISSNHPDNGTGYGSQMSIHKNSGKHVRGFFNAHLNGPELFLNDAGFFNEAGRKGAGGNINFTFRLNKWNLRRAGFGFSTFQDWNFEGVQTENHFNIGHYGSLKQGWWCGGFNFNGKRYDDAITGEDGPLLGVREDMEAWCWMGTEGNKPVSVVAKLACQPRGPNGTVRKTGGNLTIKPINRLEITTETEYIKSFRPHRWVKNANDPSNNRVDITGDLDSRSLDITNRFTFLFNNRLSLQFYNQLFFALGDYDNLLRLMSPFTYSPLEGVDYGGNPDFYKTACNSSLLMRWEYRPG